MRARQSSTSGLEEAMRGCAASLDMRLTGNKKGTFLRPSWSFAPPSLCSLRDGGTAWRQPPGSWPSFRTPALHVALTAYSGVDVDVAEYLPRVHSSGTPLAVAVTGYGGGGAACASGIRAGCADGSLAAWLVENGAPDVQRSDGRFGDGVPQRLRQPVRRQLVARADRVRVQRHHDVHHHRLRRLAGRGAALRELVGEVLFKPSSEAHGGSEALLRGARACEPTRHQTASFRT